MFDEYYKLKEAYETSVRNQKLDILKKKKIFLIIYLLNLNINFMYF